MKKQVWKRLCGFLLALVLLLCGASALAAKTITVSAADHPVEEDGYYSTMEEVAVYLNTYGKLPGNFLMKRDAEKQGWDNRAGNLDEVAPGCSIGGDHFGNYEGGVPDAKGRSWKECDINFDGGYRNGERIVFSNDGLIYYSNDHYNTFTQVVVEEGKAFQTAAAKEEKTTVKIKKNGEYTSAEEVAAYLNKYGKLPQNYLTKKEAQDLGFSNKKDNLGNVAPGCAIGGDSFGNREGLLPEAEGRSWKECDVNVENGKRGKERLVYSNDGLIYYSADNYKTFTQLY